MTSIITISPTELKSLQGWIDSLDQTPNLVTIIVEQTGIGPALRAEIETKEGEGKWKDLTDYSNW